MIGVLAFFLNHTARAKNEAQDQCQRSSNGAVEVGNEKPRCGRIERTYPWRIADSEGFSARAAYWIGGVPIAVSG